MCSGGRLAQQTVNLWQENQNKKSSNQLGFFVEQGAGHQRSPQQNSEVEKLYDKSQITINWLYSMGTAIAKLQAQEEML